MDEMSKKLEEAVLPQKVSTDFVEIEQLTIAPISTTCGSYNAN